MDMKDRIRKLLALGKSPNEHEAKSAMLKAKELMAKYKLEEADFDEKAELQQIKTNISWTTDSGNIWMASLADLIGENYCCNICWLTKRGTRTHTAQITGMGHDAELCKEVFTFAHGFIMDRAKTMSRDSIQSYANGFIAGLKEAYMEQRGEHPEWALVVVKPPEVADFEKTLGNKTVRTTAKPFDPLAYIRGQKDGRDFNPQKILGEAN